MDKKLPTRPNLDYLRRQAKSLLDAIKANDKEAIATLGEYLPAARGMNPKQIQSANFRLADAQSAVARKTGFASWPQLARHVEQLRSLEGKWAFASLEVDGEKIPPVALQYSQLLIDGDRFLTISPEATYEGAFNVNVETDPHEIDIEFIKGPEAGNWNYGIYRLDGDALQLCLDITGKSRPAAFETAPGRGHALETLSRVSSARPESVESGTVPVQPSRNTASDGAGFEFVDGPTLGRLQGEWSAVRVVSNGQELPKPMMQSGRRVAEKNEIKVTFGGQVMIHALCRVNESADPVQVDYYGLAGPAKGMVQYGIMKWLGDDACFCMAPPCRPRPADFECTVGSEHTLSVWRPARK